MLGIDLHHPPHNMGSSHGDTRITRQAIGEGSHYTPMSLRSYELISELERKVNKQLFVASGGLIISADVGKASINHVVGFFENTIAAAQEHNIKHEILSAVDVRRLFPQFNIEDDERGYYEPGAGYLKPEAIIEAHLAAAGAEGAEIHCGEELLSFENKVGGSVIVTTSNGQYETEKLVLTVGPWVAQMLPQFAHILKPYREVLYWFDVEDYARFSVPQMPIFIWQIKGHDAGIYGFPAVNGAGGGFKLASENYASVTSPSAVDRNVADFEISMMFDEKVRPYFPQALKRCVRSSVCLYTTTPDSGFVIDWLGDSGVFLCSPCSGHGFKHAQAVGELVADMVDGVKARFDLSPFKLSRF